jgi:hypothetical protein
MWIGSEFPEESEFFGLVPDCLSNDLQFDLIYLSAVDYAFNDDNLIALLSAIWPFLIDERGKCMIISETLMSFLRL